MNVSIPTMTTTQLAGSLTSGPVNTTPFAHLLSPIDAATDRVAPSKEEQVREAAQALVASTLIKPLLAQARKDPFRTDLFHGGFAEDTFGAQLDSIVAEQITSATNLSIVEAIYDRILNTGGKVDTHG